MLVQEITDRTPIPFGKFGPKEGKPGTPMANIPAKYLLWLHDEGCSHDGVRKYINENLEGLKKEAGVNRR